jgi:Flp pilus assembly protein TadG
MTPPSRSRRLARCQSAGETGQSMVEFALVVPILIVVVLGIMQAGIAYGKMLDLQSATREAARKATVSIEAEDPMQETEDALFAAVALTDDEDLTWSVSPAPPWNHGDRITVRASTPWQYNIMGVAVWSGTLRAEAQVRVE